MMTCGSQLLAARGFAVADERNDGLPPGHPGRGKTHVCAVESVDREPEVGGFVIFLPSGAMKTVHWRSAKPISPTLEAAKDYTAKVVDSLLKQHQSRPHEDIQKVNWTSVCAAVQRVILDWNDGVIGAINAKMVRDMVEGKTVTSDRRKR